MQKLSSVQGEFCRIEYQDINLNSHDQVKNFLLSEGWEPTEWNYKKDKNGRWLRDPKGHRVKSSPKLTEDSFPSIKGDLGRLVAERNILVHRRRTVLNYDDPENKGILAYRREDGRVPAVGVLCRTPTGRTAHRQAVCNIPKADEKVPYGREIRELFTCLPPYQMLGADLSQIEARVTAHYASIFDGGEYWEKLNSVGSIHEHNAKVLKCDKNTAKSFQFALYYGAQPPKIASILGCTLKEAEAHVKNFWEDNLGVYRVIKNLEKQYDRYGFIPGLDGRKLFIRAEYKLFNSLIQTGAGIVFKKWGCLANERLREAMIDCHQIIAYHDEYEYRCLADEVPIASQIIKTAATDSGKYFGMTVPIEIDIKSGSNWAEVH